MKTFEREWRKRFETFARRHEEAHLVSGWSRRGLERRVEIVTQLLARRPGGQPGLALDLGCGSGTYVRLLAGDGHRAVGVDYSRPSLAHARTADPSGSGRYLQGEAYHLPFRDGTFDLVLAIGIFLALSDPEGALDEIARVLRPGGCLVLEALNADELIARVKRAHRGLTGGTDPVRSYPPARIRSWLAARRLHGIVRAGVYLPPRRPSWLVAVLERGHLLDAVSRVPVLSTLGAHAFLTLAEKRG